MAAPAADVAMLSAASAMEATQPVTSPLPSTSPPRRSRLSVTHANALENFEALRRELLDRRLVVFLDYDGTLTPIVENPSHARLSAAMRDTLVRLQRHCTVGVISGRSLRKIQQFVDLPALYYAGSHGFDIAGPNGTTIKNQVAVEFLTDLEQLRDALQQRIAGICGAEVEDNVYSVSLHYRNVDSELQDKVAMIAQEVSLQHPQIRLSEGKMVFEYKPKVDWNKGKALIWLLQALGLDEHEDIFTVYIGDDTTDEDAFDVFQDSGTRKGAGIVVTNQSKSTGATFTLQDTTEVQIFLERLVALEAARESSVAG